MEPDVEFADSLKPLIEEGRLAQEEADVLIVKHNETVEKNAKLFARAKDAEGEAKTLKEKLAEMSGLNQPTPPEPEIVERVAELEMEREKRKFGEAHGLNIVETDRVFSLAKDQGLPPKEALENPFIKTVLGVMRSEQKTSEAIPKPSSRSPIVDGKSFAEMNDDERRKNFSKITGQK